MKAELPLEDQIKEVYENVKNASINLHKARQKEAESKLLTIKYHKAFLLAREAQVALERGL